MTRCVITRQAHADLESIGDYIARDHPTRAVTFVRELRQHCTKISRNPKMYPLREEFGSGVRKAVHGNFLILYSERAHAVVIERIAHGARDFGPQ